MLKHDSILVWPWLVRLIHWLVALCVVIDLFNETGSMHRTIGYVCSGMVLCRLAYGTWFSRLPSVKFYLPTYHKILIHIREMRAGKLSPHAGHNPLGQWAVYVMWGLILSLAFTGWLSRTDAFWGEDLPVQIHEWLAKALEILVLIHIAAVMIMSAMYRENLILTMLTGRKKWREAHPVRQEPSN